MALDIIEVSEKTALTDAINSKPGKTVNTNNGEIFNDYTNNVATGSYAHAEGQYSTASNTAAHAEGMRNIASGAYSHAEGWYATASGQGSHAEGNATSAIGLYSHAEGEGTIASGQRQHVQGLYNIEDTTSTYAHIVGNGEYQKPSNAHTLDWSGNAWYAGNLDIEGTANIKGNINITQDAIITGAVVTLDGAVFDGTVTAQKMTNTTDNMGRIVVADSVGTLYTKTPANLNAEIAAAAIGTDYSTSKLRGIKASTSDLTAGSSTLDSGTLYLVYE